MSDKEIVIKGLKEVSEFMRCKADIAAIGKGRELFDSWYRAAEDALSLFREQEPVIVQCKNCKFRHDPIRCRLDSEGLKTPDDWFCADGKRQ